MQGSRKYGLYPLLLAAVGAAGAADAQETAASDRGHLRDFGVTVGATRSDNIELTSEDETAGTIGEVGVNLLYSQESRRLQSNVDLNAAYQHYFDGDFDDEVIGGLNGMAVLALVPERFEWFVQDNFGQTRLDPRLAETPNNRENFNYFTTGPDVTLRFGQRTSLRLSGRYSLTSGETATFDGDRYSATLALIRRLSGATAVSLNVRGERLEYDAAEPDAAAFSSEYDRHEAFVRYEIDDTRTQLGLDLGYTAIDGQGDTSSGLLARLSLGRQTSTSTSVRLNLGTEFSDAGNAFRATQDLDGVSVDPETVLATSDAFKRHFANLGWAFERNRTSFGVNGEYSQEDYEQAVELNRSVAHYAVYVGRQLSPGLRLRLEARYFTEDFDTSAISTDELQGIAALNWNVGRTLAWRLQYDYRDRQGSGLSDEYTENRLSLFVSWAPLGRR